MYVEAVTYIHLTVWFQKSNSPEWPCNLHSRCDDETQHVPRALCESAGLRGGREVKIRLGNRNAVPARARKKRTMVVQSYNYCLSH